jgi:hypothetical protein
MSQENEEETHKKGGVIRRAFRYVTHAIQERAAPEIPMQDKSENEALRQRLTQTPEMQNQLGRENQVRQDEQ